jgi:hypothetical protein
MSCNQHPMHILHFLRIGFTKKVKNFPGLTTWARLAELHKCIKGCLRYGCEYWIEKINTKIFIGFAKNVLNKFTLNASFCQYLLIGILLRGGYKSAWHQWSKKDTLPRRHHSRMNTCPSYLVEPLLCVFVP